MAQKNDLIIANIALTALRFVTPLFLGILIWVANGSYDTLQNLVSAVNNIKTQMAVADANNEEQKRITIDHEGRIRILEKRVR